MLIPGFVYILSFCVWEERLPFSCLILCLCYVTEHIFNLLRACIHHIHSIICARVVVCVCMWLLFVRLFGFDILGLNPALNLLPLVLKTNISFSGCQILLSFKQNTKRCKIVYFFLLQS